MTTMHTPTTTTASPTRAQIRALSCEAHEAGDAAMVAICNLALEGDVDAVREVARVIAASAQTRHEAE